MAPNPIPHVVTASGDATDAPDGAIPVALFGGGGGETGPVLWGQIQNKPSVIAAGDDQASARAAIGAGTSNLAIGTSATTAMAGNTPIPAAATWANLTGKPETFPPATHSQGANTISYVGSGAIDGATVQLALEQVTAELAAIRGLIEGGA